MIGDITNTLSKDKRLKLTQETIETFNIYRNNYQRSEWATNTASDVEFVNNVQWSEENKQSLEANNMPPVVYNEMKPARDGVIQQITNNNPQYMAVARENSDVQTAGDASDLASYIWDRSKGNMKFVKATEHFEDMGIWIMQPYYDPYADGGRGEIKIRTVDPRDWYPDPRSQERDAQDSRNQFLGYIMTDADIRLQYPEFNFDGTEEYRGSLREVGTGSINEGQQFNIQFLAEDKHYRVIDRYQKIKVQMYRVYDPASDFEGLFDEQEYIEFAQRPALIVNKQGSQRAIIKKSEVEDWAGIIQREGTNTFHFMTDGNYMPGTEHAGGQVGQNGQLIMAVPGSTIQITVTDVLQLLEEGLIQWDRVPVDRIKRVLVIGEKLYKVIITPHSRYSFAVTMLHHTGNPYAYGDARLARPIQEQINKARSIITAYHINIASLKIFVPEGTDTEKLEKDWGKAGAQFFTYDPELNGVPIVMQFQQMANGLYDQIDRDKYLIQRLYGSYEFTEGAAAAPPETKGGTILIDEYSQRRSKMKLQFIEDALNDLGYLIGEMIPHVYTSRKVIRIVRPNQKQKQLVFNDEQYQEGEIAVVNDLKANQYDFKMISGSTLPTHRTARLDMALNLWDRQVIRDDETILRLTDLPNVDEIVARNGMLAQAQQAVQQLEGIVKELRGDKQTSDRELEHADRQISKANFEKKLHELLMTLKTATNVGTQRINDVVKEKKAAKSS